MTRFHHVMAWVIVIVSPKDTPIETLSNRPLPVSYRVIRLPYASVSEFRTSLRH